MPANVSKASKPLILHIEDNASQLRALKSILEGNDFAVLQASTGDEALLMCRETPVSLILADHMLSDTTGPALAAQIKAIKSAVPVVLHSGSPPDCMRHLDGYVHKGESVHDLVAFIHQIVEDYGVSGGVFSLISPVPPQA